jgi:hypothetical protein
MNSDFHRPSPKATYLAHCCKLFSFEALRHYEHLFKHLDFVHKFVANLYNFAR